MRAGRCWRCGDPITYDPETVPAVRWPKPDGPRRPICPTCVAITNLYRRLSNRPEVTIPEGAYAPRLRS
jgi:hypothetical protein